MAPYWEHATMSCAEESPHVRALDRRLMRDRVALNADVFYPALPAQSHVDSYLVKPVDPAHLSRLLAEARQREGPKQSLTG
jgi:hypothetical protein